MNRHRLGLLVVTLALSISTPAFADDMAAMGDMGGHDMAPNAMGGQMGMDAHMVMTSSRPQTPNDIERAHDVIDTLRRALIKYHDSRVALSEGYIWGYWKQHELPNFCPHDFAQLSVAARRALKRMRRRPSLLMAFWEQAELFPL